MTSNFLSGLQRCENKFAWKYNVVDMRCLLRYYKHTQYLTCFLFLAQFYTYILEEFYFLITKYELLLPYQRQWPLCWVIQQKTKATPLVWKQYSVLESVQQILLYQNLGRHCNPPRQKQTIALQTELTNFYLLIIFSCQSVQSHCSWFNILYNFRQRAHMGVG